MDTWFKKNRMLALGIFSLALFYLCYLFSFAQTIEAISLNRALSIDASGGGVQATSVAKLMAERAKVHGEILKRYRVDATDREGRLWQNISSLAMAKNVGITFQPVKKELDTNLVANGIWRQEFMFNGNTAQVFAFLDTLHRSYGIGRINGLKIFSAPESETEVNLELLFSGTVK